MIKEFEGRPVRAFVIWEPALPTDWTSPSTATLRRVSDPHAIQFWDHRRLISHAMGEHDDQSIVWDYVAVYQRGGVWEEGQPQVQYHGGPVVDVIEPARAAIREALQGQPPAIE